MPSAKYNLEGVFESLSDLDRFMEEFVEEGRKSPYAKKENPGNPGTDGIQKKPYKVLSKAD
jgi:hypothetical protein